MRNQTRLAEPTTVRDACGTNGQWRATGKRRRVPAVAVALLAEANTVAEPTKARLTYIYGETMFKACIIYIYIYIYIYI